MDAIKKWKANTRMKMRNPRIISNLTTSKILLLVVAIILVCTVFVSAQQYQTPKQIITQISNPFTKIIYGFTKGLYFFTSWGQQNQCSIYPDYQGWIKPGDEATCNLVGSQKCAIDIWTSSETGSQPSNIPWNNFKEVAGFGASYSTSKWIYVEIYSCPLTATPATPHNTQVYTCENGNWKSQGSFSESQTCSYDSSY